MGSALALFFFPVLSSALASGVFWVIAPLMGLVAFVANGWEPVGHDADAREAEWQQEKAAVRSRSGALASADLR